MPYSYKLGYNGPHLPEVPDKVEITKEEYKPAGTGFFGGKEEWTLHYKQPGNSGVCKISKGIHSNTSIGKIVW